MNNIGKIVFGCIAAAIIVVAIILLIPWGMSVESATEVLNNTKNNIHEKSATAKYLQIDSTYNTIYLYNPKALGDASGDVVGRIDYHKASLGEDGKEDPNAFSSGSVIIGKMKLAGDTAAQWYVIKTATSTNDTTKGYKKFATKHDAETYLQAIAGSLNSILNNSLEEIMSSLTSLNEGISEKVLGGSKAIAGAATVETGNDDKTFTKSLQISSDLVKKASYQVFDDGKVVSSETMSFKYNGELKMVESLVKGLDELE